MKTQPKIYAIRDTLIGEYCVFGGKCAFGKPEEAKAIYKNTFGKSVYGPVRDGPNTRWTTYWIGDEFDEQTQYEIVEI